MGRRGFGFGFGLRSSVRSTPSVVGDFTPLISASAGFNGTAGTGFGGAYGAVPTDPTRTTAKPACRLLTPPNQYFSESLLVGVMAIANNGGSLLDNLGLEKVICHFEGSTVDITRPTFQTFNDANGNPVTYLGWWCWLQHGGTNGHGNVYFEAVPKDATMQQRVMGPYQFSPQAAIHDREFEVAATPAEITGVRYKTLGGVKFYLDSLAAGVRPQNARITITESGTYQWLTFGGTITPQGYMTVEATVPVTIRGNPATGLLRSRYDGLHFKGKNITVDLAGMDSIHHENTARSHWLDGITLTDSNGRYAMINKSTKNQTGGARGSPWMTECDISAIFNAGGGANLIRGCDLHDGANDVMSDARCCVDSRVWNWSGVDYTTPRAAMTVTYSGAGATATLSLSGNNNTNNRVVTARVDGVSVGTFTISSTTLGATYDVADVVAWINTLPDWSATLLDDTVRASFLIHTPSGIHGFNNISVKPGPTTFSTAIDLHVDFAQFIATNENAIFLNTVVWNIDAQNIYPGTTTGMRDTFYVNCAFHLGAAGTGLVSQLSSASSHVVVAHCTLANQSLNMRTDFTDWRKFNPDAYCLVANNVMSAILWSGTPDTDLVITGNHTHGFDIHSTVPSGAVNHSTGGDGSTLFADMAAGDFTPAGALLANLKAPIVKYDRNRVLRGATAATGALMG
jgi:hypothetical protein